MSASTDQSKKRFVILFHRVDDGQILTWSSADENTRVNHWDLMFESDGQLLTWAVETEPFKSKTFDAIQLPNHRLDYLTREGPISGNRGEVTRVMAGSYCIDCDDVSTKGLSQRISEGQFRLSLISNNLSWKISFHHANGSHWNVQVTAENC